MHVSPVQPNKFVLFEQISQSVNNRTFCIIPQATVTRFHAAQVVFLHNKRVHCGFALFYSFPFKTDLLSKKCPEYQSLDCRDVFDG